MRKTKSQEIEKFLPGVKKNISLKKYTTFKIGGKAKYFFFAKTKKELIRAILIAKKYNLPFFILGGGSNLLVSDKGFKGLVIKNQMRKSKIESKVQNSEILAEAGVPLAFLVDKSRKNNLTGLEWAIGIPGTIGGAIRGNAGAFGKSIGELVKSVEVLDVRKIHPSSFSFKKWISLLKKRDCKFNYRDSIFKKKPNLIILEAKIQLKKGDKKEIEEKMKKYLDYRRKNCPLSFLSAGSIFKNLKSKIKNPKLLKEFPLLKEFNKRGSIPAAFLIEKSGLKGKRIGNVKVSEKHANFIVNLGRGKEKEVKKLIKLIKEKVKNKFKVKLEEEIEYL